MRKFAIVAIFAIVAAMVPASIASSQPTPGSLDGVGTLMIINSDSAPKDVWFKIGGDWQKVDITGTGQEEFQIPAADHSFQVCKDGSTNQLCAGSAAYAGAIPGQVHVESNDILNFLIEVNPGVVPPTNVSILENDTDQTGPEQSKLTLVGAIGLGIAGCVGDSLEVVVNPGPANLQTGEFASKDGEGQALKIVVPGSAATNCATAPANKDLGFPTGANTVINITTNPNCTSDCGYQIFPGAEPPSTSQQVDAFCAVVLDAANITPWLQALFNEVEVGNEDTYPSSDKVEKVITRVAELLEKGNQTAPKDIREVWLRATASFVETGRLAAVQYDLSALPQDDLRRLIDGVEHPGADDSEEAADTAALTAWVTTNCFHAVTAEPSFTG